MSEYPEAEVVVLARLEQRMDALCPVSGQEMSAERTMTGLTKAMIADYGDDWLDQVVADVPSGWLLLIWQKCVMTSEQLPAVVDELDRMLPARWLPRNTALGLAKKQLRRFARMKRWGGGGF